MPLLELYRTIIQKYYFQIPTATGAENRLSFLIFSALLYDDLYGLWRALFPESAWMRQRYNFQGNLLLPIYHARRLADLTFRRTL